MISVLGQCASCCECPTATVEWDSVSVTKEKCGLVEFSGYESTPPKRYLTATFAGISATVYFTNGDPCADSQDPYDIVYSGSATLDSLSCDVEACGAFLVVTEPITSTTFAYPVFITGYTPDTLRDDMAADICPHACADFSAENSSGTITETPVSAVLATYRSGVGSCTLSSEYTTALLISNAEASLPAYDDDWDDTAGSVSNLSTDELSIAIRESRYRLRFSIPTTNTGTNFRATWVERFIAEAGTTITSVSVHSAGVYRPTVTLSAPPTGGVQAHARAVMSSTGTISSISILHPGSGYTSAPTVTVQAATGGGTSSTGWVATLTAGQVTAIGSGSAGDYRPTLAFSSGGGSGATATCTLDAVGGIASVTVTAAGSAYTSEPTLTITPKVTGSTAADLLIHLGTETAKCTVWDGATPGGYAEGTPSTWPILPSAAPYYFELAVPTSDGTTLVANLRAVCDGSAC